MFGGGLGCFLLFQEKVFSTEKGGGKYFVQGIYRLFWLSELEGADSEIVVYSSGSLQFSLFVFLC